ncbi:rCG23278, partial [Rattus norvegicus]
MVKPGVC